MIHRLWLWPLIVSGWFLWQFLPHNSFFSLDLLREGREGRRLIYSVSHFVQPLIALDVCICVCVCVCVVLSFFYVHQKNLKTCTHVHTYLLLIFFISGSSQSWVFNKINYCVMMRKFNGSIIFLFLFFFKCKPSLVYYWINMLYNVMYMWQKKLFKKCSLFIP